MDGKDSRVGRVVAWAVLTALTFGLAGSVLLERTRRPGEPVVAVREEARLRALRALEQSIEEAEGRGDDESLRWLEDLRRGISGETLRQWGSM